MLPLMSIFALVLLSGRNGPLRRTAGEACRSRRLTRRARNSCCRGKGKQGDLIETTVCLPFGFVARCAEEANHLLQHTNGENTCKLARNSTKLASTRDYFGSKFLPEKYTIET